MSAILFDLRLALRTLRARPGRRLPPSAEGDAGGAGRSATPGVNRRGSPADFGGSCAEFGSRGKIPGAPRLG